MITLTVFKRQIIFFVFIGFISVFVDYLVYSLSFKILAQLNLSKQIGFIAGSVFAYYANKNFTFNLRVSGTILMQVKYWFAVIFVMNINSMVNEFIFNNYQLEIVNSYHLAFLVATTVSAIINFLLFKHFVFRSK